MSNWAWATYGLVGVSVIVFLVFFVVITIGGVFDLAYLFKELRREQVDSTDDGRARDAGDDDAI